MVTKECKCCGKPYTTHQVNRSTFCSKPCRRRHRCQTGVDIVDHTFICKGCGDPVTIRTNKYQVHKHKGWCIACANAIRSGEDSPTWKGGHRHWAPGRFGRDKDGLSWKTQRKLAWERDEFTCQHCHTKGSRNPDVHHISPFRVSLSHALDNLICLCQKCHLTEEAKVQDQWGGQLSSNGKAKVQ